MRLKWWSCLMIVGIAMCAAQAQADPTYYTIQSSQSSLNLTVTGNILGGSATVTEQNAAAITRYSGNIVGVFPGGAGVGSDITFPGGSDANAINTKGTFLTNQYSPNIDGKSGTAPANYGVNVSAPVGIVIPPFDIPDVGTINLGTLQSVDVKMAIRDLTLDVHGGPIDIEPGFLIDASQTSLSIENGFADISGQLVFKQADILSWGTLTLLLNGLAAAYPDLGITVSTNILQLTNSVGFGTRLDLSTLGNPMLPNTTALSGSVTGSKAGTSSTLILPVTVALPSLDVAGIIDLDLTLDGQLRATGIVVPEPSTFALAGIGLLGMLGYAVRKRRLAS